jgi:hypothetical protein
MDRMAHRFEWIVNCGWMERDKIRAEPCLVGEFRNGTVLGIPPMFFEECARVVGSMDWKSMEFGSVQVIRNARVAAAKVWWILCDSKERWGDMWEYIIW